jgi:hypothetical protein
MKGVVNNRAHLEALLQRRGKAVGSLVWDRQITPREDVGLRGLESPVEPDHRVVATSGAT